MSEKKLLPCPFCGGEAKRAVIFGRNGIECRKCLCMMRGWLDATPEEIAEQWNTRKPMERIMQRLEEQQEESCKLYAIAFNAEDRGSYDAYSDAIDIVKEEST